jgi:hypothetical protein
MRYIGRIISISSFKPLGVLEYQVQDGEDTFSHKVKFFFGDCSNFRPEVGLEVSFELAPFRALNLKELKGHGKVFLVNFTTGDYSC